MNKTQTALLNMLAQRVRIFSQMLGEKHPKTITALLQLSDERARIGVK
jgi:hypothetical protein